jgi:hypothetical protein
LAVPRPLKTAAEVQGLKGMLLRKSREELNSTSRALVSTEAELQQQQLDAEQATQRVRGLRDECASLIEKLREAQGQRQAALARNAELVAANARLTHAEAAANHNWQLSKEENTRLEDRLAEAQRDTVAVAASLDAETTARRTADQALASAHGQLAEKDEELSDGRLRLGQLQRALQTSEARAVGALADLETERQAGAMRDWQHQQLGLENDRHRTDAARWKQERDEQIAVARREMAAARMELDGCRGWIHAADSGGSMYVAEAQAAADAVVQNFRGRTEDAQSDARELRMQTVRLQHELAACELLQSYSNQSSRQESRLIPPPHR